MDVVIKQLQAARAGIDAALAVLVTASATQTGPQVGPQPCTHPAKDRRPLPVSGDMGQYQCVRCHSLVSGNSGVEL